MSRVRQTLPLILLMVILIILSQFETSVKSLRLVKDVQIMGRELSSAGEVLNYAGLGTEAQSGNVRLRQWLERAGDRVASDSNAYSNDKKGNPMNVILFYPDDWRHDSIGGVAPVVKTPFLNQLARDGIRFTHNMVTTSICWISRATLFTGQYASRHKSLRLRTPEFYKSWHNTSWPALLQQAGYFVGHVGKWQYYNYNNTVESFFNFTSLFEGYHWYGKTSGADKARDETFKFLKERPKDHPFALTVAFYPPKAVGESYEAGAQWKPKEETRVKYYSNETIPEPPYDINASYHRLPWFFQKEERIGRQRWQQRFDGPEKYQEAMKNYYSLITEVDIACREITEELERQGVLNNTLIIFTTDNGLFHAEHGLAGKWYPYQESIRVPLIVRDPRMPGDRTNTLNDALTLNIDLAPTILGAAGITPPSSMQGRDISKLYLNEEQSWRDEFYYEFPINNGKQMPMSSAVVRHDIKYLYWPRYRYEELFNLTEDPLEQNNVWSDGSYAAILQELRERHDELQASVL